MAYEIFKRSLNCMRSLAAGYPLQDDYDEHDCLGLAQ